MELRHLRYFVAVAEALNFRRAAELLHISAPTLSVQIRDLEDRLDARLLERDTTRVRLTVAGEVFLAEAKALLEQVQRSVTVTQDAARGRRGTLRIGNVGELSYEFMSASLNTYRERFPDVDVTLVDIGVDEQCVRSLDKGEFQIGFAFEPATLTLTGLRHFQVLDTLLKVVVADTHPLAAQRRISLADLAGVRLLAAGKHTKSSMHAEYMLSLLRHRGVTPGPVKMVGGSESFFAMLAAGQEASLLPKIRRISSREGLSALSIKEKGPDLRFQLHAIWRSDETSPLVKNFLEVLKSHRAGRS
ncbi:LysR family transcriptional regulator [Geminisphaera colitermitum]|uniref:LysR family transcriptional regulator n=1 Tax=Geminisphaera colitermitum TaxID=1148786 RepID=UPI000158CF09|nr:LysR substrate-binding domain-containing protein [Geminisphaera colitermitum]